MSRLSRDQKRGRSAEGTANDGRAGSGSGMAPIEVRVPADVRDGAPGARATVGGVPVVAGPGEPAQQAVLNHLHRLALATGHPVLASVQDERIGYVVPIRVHADGSSEFTGEPVPMGAAHAVPPATEGADSAPAVVAAAPTRPAEGVLGEAEPRDTATHVLRALDAQKPTPGTTAPTFPLKAVQDPEATPPTGVEARTHVLRAVPEPSSAQPAAPAPQPAPAPSAAPATAPHPQLNQAAGEAADGAPGRPGATVTTSVQRAVAEQGALITATSGPAQALPGAPDGDGLPQPPREATPPPHIPGTVSPPTGTFGPPPVLPVPPAAGPAPAKPVTWPTPAPSSAESPEVAVPPTAFADPGPAPHTEAETEAENPPFEVKDDEIKEPPVREFAVAEAVFGGESGAEPSTGAGGPLAEPMARINAAVKQGRIEEAAGLAERTVAESAAGLGSDHPDVLRLRELTAYIAYLAGDPLHSFHLSLDLSRIRHRLGDPRGAYGNVQSAAAAWRAVRDPIQGLQLGRDLIAVWTGLAAEEGPAADDLDQLQRARSRMGRLAERARGAAGTERPSAP